VVDIISPPKSIKLVYTQTIKWANSLYVTRTDIVIHNNDYYGLRKVVSRAIPLA